ncbi:MAG: glucose-6-phosphate dehydrogenase [Candidatus Daviesbacteria bacterium]|nr:glucose-6-phosphate dehydrogenase [Candidatus Daviesbacteria bacterium]
MSLSLIIFGITSNLAQKYLLPALYDLEEKGLLPENTSIIGVARSPKEEGWIQEHLDLTLSKENLHHKHTIQDPVKQALLKRLHYLNGHLDDPEFYQRLHKKLTDLNSKNLIFYLATYPELYQAIFQNLKDSKLHKSKTGFVRLMIEKPFGQDLNSAKALNKLLHQFFEENQIYRLDHYLGKETLRGILEFRFKTSSNLQPLIDSRHIDHIQVTAIENFGIGERGAFYDRVGALKDVGQNHLLQMLTAATMDKPAKFTNEEVTSERIKILKKLTPLKDSVVFGQYQGYLSEKNVNPSSKTETFFALKTFINNDRFKDIPIYIRAGKKLAQTLTEVVIVFKQGEPKLLRFKIQPEEQLLMSQDPYEALILDAIRGDQTFFNDAEEVEIQWAFIDPLASKKGQPIIYQPGTDGPKEADLLIRRDGRSWAGTQTSDFSKT